MRSVYKQLAYYLYEKEEQMHGADEFLCRHRVALKCEAVELVDHRSKQII